MGMTKNSNKSGIQRSKRGSKKDSGGASPSLQAKPSATEEIRERIWQAVSLIPRGKVASYGQIAALIGSPRHSRLVGQTLRNLPKNTRLPWYRVVNSQLRISQRGGGEVRQRQLLTKEGIEFVGERVAKGHRWETDQF